MTEQKNDRNGQSECVPEVPSEVLTPDGQTVDTSDDVWRLDVRAKSKSRIKINSSSSFGRITNRSLKLIRLYLAERLRSVKPVTVKNDLDAFKSFVRWCNKRKDDIFKWREIDESDWREFLDKCNKSMSNRGGYFSRIRPFYRWGAFQKGFSDFDRDVASSISLIRAPGNDKGKAVRTLDPHRGPLDDDEIKLIHDALDEKAGTVEKRVVVRLFLELGIRPLAVTLIRGKHLLRHDVPVAEKGKEDRKTMYQLEVPKLKSREAEITKWYTRPLSDELGEALERVSQSDEELLLGWLAEYQSPEKRIGIHLNDWVAEAGLISPRTGELLNLFPRRFRRTLATDMAVQGASKAQIAQALGHKDLQNVDVYMDASAAILDRMEEDDAFDFQDEVVDLFMGKVGDPDDEDVSEQRIPGAAPQVGGLKETTGHIGACQKSSPCSLTPPLSCYTCKKFVAFEDAPHEDIKDELENWIEGSPEGIDRRIPQQHVTTLKAIRQLLQQLRGE